MRPLTSDFFVSTTLFISRASISFLMLTHGWPKLKKLIAGGEISFADPIGLGPTISLVLVVFSEVICSLFIALGYKIRWALMPLIFTMLVAAFITHAGAGIYKQEKALLYIIVYLMLAVTGGGRFSMDAWLGNRSKR